MTRWLILLSLVWFAACAASQPALSGAPTQLRRADAAYERGDYSEAVLLYRAFLGSHASDAAAAQATYRMAAAYYRLGRYDEAAKTIEVMRADEPESDGPTVWVLYGDIEAARGHNVSAILWWDRAYQAAPPGDRGQISARVSTLAGTMSDEERKQARNLVNTGLVQRELESPRRPTPATRPTATPAETAPPTETPGPDSARIGLLVPLSGKNRAIGEASLDGARIAATREEDLVALDTGGTPAGTTRQFEALSADVSVAAIVGPLRADDTNAVVPRASAESMTLLPLSQGEVATSPYVYQTAMTRTLQAQTIAAYAVRKLGLRRFAIAYPGDAYGARYADLFRSAVRAEGGTIVGTVTYSPGQTEFAHQVDELQALEANGAAQAVFLPDSAATIALLAPEIRREMPRIQLLGSSEWNEGFILAGVANSLEGAIFVDGFHAQSARPATRTFVEKYRRRFGRRPGILEAQAHDAVALIEAAVARGAFTRQEIQLMLENLGIFEGAGGTIEISAGVVRRQLFVLRFTNGSLEELAW